MNNVKFEARFLGTFKLIEEREQDKSGGEEARIS